MRRSDSGVWVPCPRHVAGAARGGEHPVSAVMGRRGGCPARVYKLLFIVRIFLLLRYHGTSKYLN